MTYMTRAIKTNLTIASLIILVSCNAISYTELYPYFKNAVVGVPDIEINDEYIKNKKYSFIRTRFGKSATAIFSLSSINNNIYTWVNGESELLKTYNGKVIYVNGVGMANMQIHNFEYFSPKISKENAYYQIQFKDPGAFISQSATYSVNYENNLLKLDEKFSSNPIRWHRSNKYLFDSRNMPSRTEQYINPNLPLLEIDFYFLYK
jgi:hypothetical protein